MLLHVTGFLKLWPLQNIQTDGLVGLRDQNRVLLALAFRLTNFRKPDVSQQQTNIKIKSTV